MSVSDIRSSVERECYTDYLQQNGTIYPTFAGSSTGAKVPCGRASSERCRKLPVRKKCWNTKSIPSLVLRGREQHERFSQKRFSQIIEFDFLSRVRIVQEVGTLRSSTGDWAKGHYPHHWAKGHSSSLGLGHSSSLGMGWGPAEVEVQFKSNLNSI
jgi:hypothetical protein